MARDRGVVIERPRTARAPDRSRRERARLPWSVRPRTRTAQAVCALLAYVGVSFLFFGLPIVGRFGTSYIGLGNPRLGPGIADPSFYMWSFVWWPHAIAHGINPFFTHVVWAPTGFNLAWATSVPGAALVLWPITRAFGPVVSYNVIMILAPALAGWTAYLLCRHVTGRFWPSLIGGYLFGFSSYELAQMTVHLDLALIFVVPLCVYLFLLRFEDRMRPAPFVILLALALVAQFSFFPEVFFTMALFGGVAVLVALAVLPAQSRRRLLSVAGWTALAFAVAGVVLSPYLYFALAHGFPRQYATWPSRYATDLLNLAVPTKTAWIGRGPWAPVAARFKAGLAEEGAFLGPLLIVVVAYAIKQWRTAVGKILLVTLGVVILAALGPLLRIGGTGRYYLPWHLLVNVPLISNALPARFIMYAWVIVALIAAIWLSTAHSGRQAWTRWAIVGACALALYPNLGAPLWRAPVREPSFFASDTYPRYLVPGKNTLVIPFGSRGFSMLWQARTGLDFTMTGGYVACLIPEEFQRWPIVYSFLTAKPIPDQNTQLLAFLAAHDVGTVVVQDGLDGFWESLFSPLGQWTDVGGVRVYRPSPRLVAGYQDVPPDGSRAEALSHKCS